MKISVLLASVIAIACTSGCTTVVTRDGAHDPAPTEMGGQADLTPPVPTFTSVSDCELAYGTAACGTGAAIYQAAGIAVPAGATDWYAPYAFGVMTGVLLNRFFQPPAVFVAETRYRDFLSPTVVHRYTVIDRGAIDRFYRAPASIRRFAERSHSLDHFGTAHRVAEPHYSTASVPMVRAGGTTTEHSAMRAQRVSIGTAASPSRNPVAITKATSPLLPSRAAHAAPANAIANRMPVKPSATSAPRLATPPTATSRSPANRPAASGHAGKRF